MKTGAFYAGEQDWPKVQAEIVKAQASKTDLEVDINQTASAMSAVMWAKDMANKWDNEVLAKANIVVVFGSAKIIIGSETDEAEALIEFMGKLGVKREDVKHRAHDALMNFSRE